MTYPPIPTYPDDYDTDRTLFLVHNTTESRLCENNNAWASELTIIPVGPDDPEIWPDNGFATIEGEMFYYDAVLKNDDGKVFKLIDCARNLAGSKTKFNPKGTWVRGFVVAEHHNQILSAVLRAEEFIGYDFTDETRTLDWRIRNLQSQSIIFDDFQCPDVNFTFNIIETDNQTGVLAEYDVRIDPVGAMNGYRLDFGDGEYTTTALSGTHRYALTATIDPVVTISNDKCQIVITPSERSNPVEPPAAVTQVFDIPIPEIPEFPDFTLVPYEIPDPEIQPPPFIFPCISMDAGTPTSVVIDPELDIMSQIVFTGIDNPINLPHSEVRIVGDVNIPSIVFFDVPPTIVIDPPIPPTIVVVTSTTTPSSMAIDWNTMPELKVNWGEKPEMNVNLQFAKQVKMQSASSHFGSEFADLFDESDHIQIEYETVGIPSEIMIVPPIMPKIEVDAGNIPKTIKLQVEEADLPNLKIDASNVPRTINIDAESIPTEISLVGRDIPRQIQIETPKLPEKIDMILSHPIPEKVIVEVSNPIPDKILVESDIQVVGFPEFIEVRGIPDSIQLRPPETMPQVEMVYKGAPIELKLVMDQGLPTSPDGKKNCVMITPCV